MRYRQGRAGSGEREAAGRGKGDFKDKSRTNPRILERRETGD